jgi:ribosome-associated protein
LRGISTFTDFFVVCSGTSEPHLKAIATEVREQMREKFNEKPTFADGIPASHWVVLDYSDVMLHVFTEEKRAFYALESLWGDAKQTRIHDEKPAPRTARRR